MKQLDQKAVWLFFIGSIFRWVFFLVMISFWLLSFSEGAEQSRIGGEFSFTIFNWLWVIIPVFLLLCFLWAKLSYHFYRYELTDLGFRKEYGVIYKKYVTIPYDRIQNVDIYRGILARILGLSDLNIQTAGSSAGVMTGEGRLPGISKETAEYLRDELILKTRQSKVGQGL
ncbi:MAG: hypothetical protein A2431_02865 [Candidatus Zambryskibacteria bacterium RIFOXYC1_FULL_39_10]|uniref:YdbS-like PH domain-containing protein n=1 Tax=Candidatus Zambryskibacteria bacterium RIFOXYC1_FULL_39_10 TaxID=1802779 RepID=A0A1G2UZZ7_9BACT|nr:MAG: hypothetical protein A2605_02205 [Candidatus Zambryskibacteria bacterium RIFOXYD1_FULL_39_35]OHB14965.1 MAG: hypothetical protein A2431_02865 [Candidatus Zambryskibacteria bacterium RIFOXYC1_FULL_39_10]